MISLDKIQIINYLINCNAIKPQRFLYFIKYYSELGFMKGLIYYYIFHYFDDIYAKALRSKDSKNNENKRSIRTVSSQSIGITMNPMITIYIPNETEQEITRNEKNETDFQIEMRYHNDQ